MGILYGAALWSKHWAFMQSLSDIELFKRGEMDQIYIFFSFRIIKLNKRIFFGVLLSLFFVKSDQIRGVDLFLILLEIS